MTWVVGASSITGHGLLISDVRITFGDGTEADLLRKSYPIAPYMLAGFAGSVDIGLRLVDSLQRFLHIPDLPDDAVWQPEWVAENWSPLAAELFAAAPSYEQDAGSQIITVGVSPNEDMGVPEFRRVYVTKYDWPHFNPQHIEKGHSVCHIGSGACVEDYEKGVSEFFKFGSVSMMSGLKGGPLGWSAMIASSVRHLVSDNPVSGISPHVFIDTVALGGFWSGNNDVTIHPPDGSKIEFRMPEVAQTYAEFVALCRKREKAAARAIA